MGGLIRFFIDRHMLVHVIVGVVVTLGLLASTRSPLETFPNVTLPTLFVSGVLPGASVRDVETKIAIPIQEAVEELNGLKEFETVISDAQSRTTVELDDDWGDARVREAERDLRVLIDGIRDFPPEMEDEPFIMRLNPQLFPVVQIALAGPTDRLIEGAKLLERRLRRLDQISKVTLVGLEDSELRIFVDPVRAQQNGVTVLDVVDAVRTRNVSATGGTLESVGDRRQVVLWSRFEDPQDVASTVVRFTPEGGAVTVGDVARLELGREDTGLVAHTNGQPGITAIVVKQESADIVDTVDRVKETVEATALPEGVSFAYVRDESFMARNRLQLMWNNGLLGIALVAIVLFVFLTPVSAAWTLAGLPVVFLATLALFPVVGFRINMVTLTGLVIVLGMVVDDAIVVSERIVSRRQAGEERKQAAVNGAREMGRPVLASAITTMLAFMPLWGMGGMNGKFTAAMPAVVMLALAMSVAESFLILPAHLSMGMGTAGSGKRAFVRRMEERYRKLLRVSLRHRVLLTGSFATVLVLVLVVIAPRMQVVLFPQDDSEAAFILVTTPLGTPVEQTAAVVTSIEGQLKMLMGGRHHGRASEPEARKDRGRMDGGLPAAARRSGGGAAQLRSRVHGAACRLGNLDPRRLQRRPATAHCGPCGSGLGAGSGERGGRGRGRAAGHTPDRAVAGLRPPRPARPGPGYGRANGAGRLPWRHRLGAPRARGHHQSASAPRPDRTHGPDGAARTPRAEPAWRAGEPAQRRDPDRGAVRRDHPSPRRRQGRYGERRTRAWIRTHATELRSASGARAAPRLCGHSRARVEPGR
jgi:multidrug efflux pump subunit AcrB